MDRGEPGWLSQGLEIWTYYWPAVAAAISVLMALAASVHLLFSKRDPRAAAAWMGLVWLLPVVGPVLYLILGINRIRRRARQLTGGDTERITGWRAAAEPAPGNTNLHSLAQLVGDLTTLPLAGGNQIKALTSRDALAEMLNAIHAARDTVYLSTYIFGNDEAGRVFVEALRMACERGVRVRVLVDGVGSWY